MRDEGEQLPHKQSRVEGQWIRRKTGGRLTCSNQNVFGDSLALQWRSSGSVWHCKNQWKLTMGDEKSKKTKIASWRHVMLS